MALKELPLAQGGIYRDFESDVLAQLIKHDARMHGCPVTRVECKLDGSIAVWFKGPRPGVAMWEGALKANLPILEQKKAFADVNATTEIILQILDNIAAKDQQPIIQRAQ